MESERSVQDRRDAERTVESKMESAISRGSRQMIELQWITKRAVRAVQSLSVLNHHLEQ